MPNNPYYAFPSSQRSGTQTAAAPVAQSSGGTNEPHRLAGVIFWFVASAAVLVALNLMDIRFFVTVRRG